MTDLDLSFLEPAGDNPSYEKSEPQAPELNLDFMETVGEGEANYDPPEELGIGGAVSDFFTGNDRATELTDSLPELHQSGILHGESRLQNALSTPALMTSVNTDEIVKVLTGEFPNISVVYNKDAQGNPFPILVNSENGAATVINRPGISGFDVVQGLGLGAAFFSVGKLATGASSILAGGVKVGAGSAGIQTAIEGLQAAGGGDFNTGDVALAGVFGGIFQSGMAAFGAAWPTIKRQITSGRIPEEVKAFFKREGAKLDVPEELITDDAIKQWADKVDTRTGLEREFDVTLSNAQRSGDQAALSTEDSFRSGIKGDGAQREYLKGEAKQLNELSDATTKLQEGVAGDSPLINHRNEAGSAIGGGTREAETVAENSIIEAYKAVGEASLDPSSFKKLIIATLRATDGVEYPKSGNVTAWKAVQSDIQKSLKIITNTERLPGAKLKQVHIKQLERIRVSLGNYAETADNMTDKRNVLAMKMEFDQQIDKAVIKGLFSGDETSIAKLKEARTIFKRYMDLFGEKVTTSRLGTARDGSGAFIRQIVLENPTDETVINSLWTSSGFGRDASANLAKRYKEILGAGSDEWGMVRQAALDRIIAKKIVKGEEVIDGAKTFSNYQKANLRGKSLFDVIFSKEEMAKIGRFAQLSKRTVPEFVRSRENPSGTAKKLITNSAASLRAFLPFFDVGVSVSGALLLKGARSKAAARNAFNPRRPFSEVRKKLLENLKEIGAAIKDPAQGYEEGIKAGTARSALTPLTTEGSSGT